MAKPQDLSGQKFNRLLVLKTADRSYWKNSQVRVICKCDCGYEGIFRAGALKNGNTKSCGCLAKEVSRANVIKNHPKLKKHGMSHTTEYNTWTDLKSRCCNKANKHYKDYGGRGIIISDEWFHSFETFYKDMGPKPDPTYSIDRINNDGNYEKSNCKWSSPKEQAQNRRPRYPTKA